MDITPTTSSGSSLRYPIQPPQLSFQFPVQPSPSSSSQYPVQTPVVPTKTRRRPLSPEYLQQAGSGPSLSSQKRSRIPVHPLQALDPTGEQILRSMLLTFNGIPFYEGLEKHHEDFVRRPQLFIHGGDVWLGIRGDDETEETVFDIYKEDINEPDSGEHLITIKTAPTYEQILPYLDFPVFMIGITQDKHFAQTKTNGNVVISQYQKLLLDPRVGYQWFSLPDQYKLIKANQLNIDTIAQIIIRKLLSTFSELSLASDGSFYVSNLGGTYILGISPDPDTNSYTIDRTIGEQDQMIPISRPPSADEFIAMINFPVYSITLEYDTTPGIHTERSTIDLSKEYGIWMAR